MKDVEEYKVIEGDNMNLLFEGDNINLFPVLKDSYKGCIDCICLDPPYNTGNKFIYPDKMKESDWVEFMKDRLSPARDLLSDKGVIFIFINDKNLCLLKTICDEVFGRDNFINILPRLVKNGGDQASIFNISLDYVICYANNISKVKLNKLPLSNSVSKSYRFSDERGLYKTEDLSINTIKYSKSMDYEIEIEGTFYRPGYVTKEEQDLRKASPSIGDYSWRWSKDLFNFAINNNYIVVKKGKLYSKIYKNYSIKKVNGSYRIIENEKLSPNATNDLIRNEYCNRIGKEDLTDILPGCKFEFPKPVALIKHILFLATDKSSVVLDYFGGSGTTAQACVELNQEDGGQRQFILCQKDEADICETVTYQRISNVVKKTNGKEGVVYFKLS